MTPTVNEPTPRFGPVRSFVFDSSCRPSDLLQLQQILHRHRTNIDRHWMHYKVHRSRSRDRSQALTRANPGARVSACLPSYSTFHLVPCPAPRPQHALRAWSPDRFTACVAATHLVPVPSVTAQVAPTPGPCPPRGRSHSGRAMFWDGCSHDNARGWPSYSWQSSLFVSRGLPHGAPSMRLPRVF